MQERLRALREQTATAERAVIEFARDQNIVKSADGKFADDQQLAALNNQLVAARNVTSEALARLFRIQAIVKGTSPDGSAADPTVSDALKDQVITNLRQKYLELVGREAEWSARFGANHQAVVNLRNQEKDIRDSIFAELQRLAESYKSDYAIAKQHEDDTQKTVTQLVSRLHLTNQGPN